MKSILAAFAFIAVVSVGAWYGLTEFGGWGADGASAERSSVRLD